MRSDEVSGPGRARGLTSACAGRRRADGWSVRSREHPSLSLSTG